MARRDSFIYDVGHNPDGIKMLLNSIKKLFENQPLFGLLCLKGDKNINQIGKVIADQFEKLFITSDKEGLLIGADKLSDLLFSRGIKNKTVDSVSDGIAQLDKSIQNSGVAIIFGTHYIANEVFEEFENSFDRVIN